MKRLILRWLFLLARKTIRVYHPRVVAVTGSVGKTSVRHAIVTALGDHESVRFTEGNYNNEFGVPLTILGETSPGRSALGWVGVLWRGYKVAHGWAGSYPRVLVMEYGADKKGDIQYLTQIARPDVAVVTSVGVAHAEFLGTIEDVAEEKGALVRAVAEDGVVLLNVDDPRVEGMRRQCRGGCMSYGLGLADVCPTDVQVDVAYDGDMTPDEVVCRTTFFVTAGGQTIPIVLTNVLGDAHVRSVLAGVAVAVQLGVDPSVAARNVSRYQPMPGRLRMIAGVKHALLLDDSYNASPDAVHAALDALCSIRLTGDNKRIAVLGDMRELGRYTEAAHTDIGRHVASLPIDLLVTVGELARDIARGAVAAGMDQSRCVTYARAAEAGRFVQERLGRGDVVLIKGSQGSRTEMITRELMAEPAKAPQELVRQYGPWLNDYA